MMTRLTILALVLLVALSSTNVEASKKKATKLRKNPNALLSWQRELGIEEKVEEQVQPSHRLLDTNSTETEAPEEEEEELIEPEEEEEEEEEQVRTFTEAPNTPADQDESTDNGPVELVFTIDSEIFIKFFPHADIDGNNLPGYVETALESAEAFFVDTLWEAAEDPAHANLGNDYRGYDVANIAWTYDQEKKELHIPFDSIIDINPATTETPRTVAYVMSQGNIENLLNKMKAHDIPSMNVVRFTATGRGARRR